MTATPLRLGPADGETGIRPFDLHRDLRQVADLVGEAFANELDADSLSALRELRFLGSVSRYLSLGYLNSLSSFALFEGFVCTDEARVVGNISWQKLDSYGQRWQIANIAVARSHQRRGIARSLVQSAISYLQDVGAQYAVLQVQRSNRVAFDLYVKFGFQRMGGTTVLAGRTPLRPPSDGVSTDLIQPVKGASWRHVYDLAQAQMGHHTRWWRPLKRGEFIHDWPQRFNEGITAVLGHSQVTRMGIPNNARQYTTAARVQTHLWQRHHRVEMWTRPQLYGRYETGITSEIVRRLNRHPGFKVQVKIDADHQQAIEALLACGLKEEMTLETMRCVLNPAPRSPQPRLPSLDSDFPSWGGLRDL